MEGSGTSAGGELLIWTLKPEPLGTRAAAKGKLEDDEFGDNRDSDEERGFRPGRCGPGVRYGRLFGAGEKERLPDGVAAGELEVE